MDRASRNKTIATTVEEGGEYLARCLPASELRRGELPVNRTVLGDCFDVLPLLPPDSVDLLIADPPYNLRKEYDREVFAKQSDEEYASYTRRWLSLAAPLVKETGSIYVCCDWESSLIVGRVLGEFFRVRNRITWQREKGRGAAANWKNSMEDIWFATRSDSYTFHLDAVKQRRKVLAPYRSDGKPKDWTETPDGNYRDTCPSNFWDAVTVPFWSMPENTAHPAQKPEKLLAKLILASSSPGDLVLDPFLGSGSVSVTAKKLGRRWLGIEREPRYCIWAEQRLERADSDLSIQGYEDGVFWARGEQPRR